MVMAIFDFVNLFVNERKRKDVYEGIVTYSNFKADIIWIAEKNLNHI